MEGVRIPAPVAELVERLMGLPGIGMKTAQRLAFFLIDMEEENVIRLAKALVGAKRGLVSCQFCGMVDERDPCLLCADSKRDARLLCVVEEVRDIWAMERTGAYEGRYHVLHGSIAPAEGKGPDELNISMLLERVQKGDIAEVILATNCNIAGETTAMYLAELLPAAVKVTRIAHGLPVGSDLE